MAQPSRATSATRRVESGVVMAKRVTHTPYVIMLWQLQRGKTVNFSANVFFFVDFGWVPILQQLQRMFAKIFCWKAVKSFQRASSFQIWNFRGVAVLPSSYLRTYHI